MLLLGKKKFHSNKKDADYYQLVLGYNGDAGCGTWVDQPFISKEFFDKIPESDYGKNIKLDYEYQPGRSVPVVIGYSVLSGK